MPSGNVHNVINSLSFGVLAVGAAVAQQQQLLHLTTEQLVTFSAAYVTGTFLLSPDLDLAEGNVNSKRYWGALGVLWVPYGKLFSHRGLSHTWLVGPLTRLIYLGLMILLLTLLLMYLLPSLHVTPPRWPRQLDWPLVGPGLLGYYMSQWLHLIADGVRPDHDLKHARKTLRRLK